MINAALNDAAAMTVSANSNTVRGNSGEYELRVSSCEVVEALLDNVVSVEVLNHGNNLVLQCVDYHLDLTTTVSGSDEEGH